MIRRACLGWLAAVLSVLIVHQGVWEALHLGLVPGLGMPPAWPLSPVPPWGVPLLLDLCFWGGLYGVAYGLAAPRPWWLAGACLGALAVLVAQFVVTPLKGGIPWQWPGWAIGAVVNVPWGIGVAGFFTLLRRREAAA